MGLGLDAGATVAAEVNNRLEAGMNQWTLFMPSITKSPTTSTRSEPLYHCIVQLERIISNKDFQGGLLLLYVSSVNCTSLEIGDIGQKEDKQLQKIGFSDSHETELSTRIGVLSITWLLLRMKQSVSSFIM